MWRLSYRLLRTVSGIGFWFGARLTPAGGLVLGAAIVSGALGVDTHQTLAYQLFSLLMALLLMAWVSSLLLRPRFHALRHAPRAVTAEIGRAHV